MSFKMILMATIPFLYKISYIYMGSGSSGKAGPLNSLIKDTTCRKIKVKMNSVNHIANNHAEMFCFILSFQLRLNRLFEQFLIWGLSEKVFIDLSNYFIQKLPEIDYCTQWYS